MTKPLSPQLAALLASDADLFISDCFRFDLVGGGVLRYTDADTDLSVNGQTFSAGGIQIGPFLNTDKNRGRATWSIGSQPQSMTFDVIPGAATVLGQAFLQACQDGVFDGAKFTRSRLYMPTFGDTRRGPLRLDVCRVAEVDVGRSKATFVVNDYRELLDQNFPRNIYQAGCVNNLGDSACTVNLAALAVAGTVTTATVDTIAATLAVSPTGEFNQGKVTFTSGTLNGVSRTVKDAMAGAPGSIALLFPLPSAPAPGDTFNIFPGCDKTFAGTNGCPKFSNTANWRGTDLIPVAETAV